MKKYLSLLVTLGVMAAIFVFSAQPGSVSGAVSETVADTLQDTGAQHLVPGWFSPNAYANIRKWAHVYIYLALGASMAVTVGCFCPGQRRLWQGMTAGVLCLLYAVTDEIHQYFVPGRAMLAGDVLVDAAGFAAGILLVLLARWLWTLLQKNR